MLTLYRGFSTVSTTGLNTAIYDIDLVKQDLLNEFNTRLGDRPMRPFFGSIIPDLLFDMFDERTEGLVSNDIKRILNGDPRVRLVKLNINVNPNEHTIQAEILLKYLEFNMEEWFITTFQGR